MVDCLPDNAFKPIWTYRFKLSAPSCSRLCIKFISRLADSRLFRDSPRPGRRAFCRLRFSVKVTLESVDERRLRLLSFPARRLIGSRRFGSDIRRFGVSRSCSEKTCLYKFSTWAVFLCSSAFLFWTFARRFQLFIRFENSWKLLKKIVHQFAKIVKSILINSQFRSHCQTKLPYKPNTARLL